MFENYFILHKIKVNINPKQKLLTMLHLIENEYESKHETKIYNNS